MKYFIVAILLSACLLSIGQARTIEEPIHVEKRFLSEVWDWIQGTIIRPINDHVINPVVDGNLIDTKSNKIIHFIFISSFLKKVLPLVSIQS